MYELSFAAYDPKQKDRLVALICLGMVQAIRNQALTFDEAGLQLFWPEAWREILVAGCSPAVVSIIQAAAELEDAHDLTPDAFAESLNKINRKILAFLRKTGSTPDEEVERWLLVEKRSFRRKGSSTQDPSTKWWDQMSAWEFEQLIANALENLGYAVTPVISKSDRGLDFISVKDGVQYGIQVKKYKRQKVSADAVHSLIDRLERNGLQSGLLITTTSFTDEANQAAKSKGVELWDLTALGANSKISTASPSAMDE